MLLRFELFFVVGVEDDLVLFMSFCIVVVIFSDEIGMLLMFGLIC